MAGLDRGAPWLPVFGRVFALFACGQSVSSPHQAGASGQDDGGSSGAGGPPRVLRHACQNQGHSLTRAELEPLLGTYEVTYFTYNPKGCDNEGASCLLMGQSTHAVLSAAAGGSVALQIATCASVAACAAGTFDGSVFSRLEKALASGSPCATQFSTGFHDQSEPVCREAALVDTTLSRIDPTHLRLTERRALFDAPEAGPGACSTATAETTLEAACSSLRVLELQFVEP